MVSGNRANVCYLEYPHTPEVGYFLLAVPLGTLVYATQYARVCYMYATLL